jgi:hypothetical protein
VPQICFWGFLMGFHQGFHGDFMGFSMGFSMGCMGWLMLFFLNKNGSNVIGVFLGWCEQCEVESDVYFSL